MFLFTGAVNVFKGEVRLWTTKKYQIVVGKTLTRGSAHAVESHVKLLQLTITLF